MLADLLLALPLRDCQRPPGRLRGVWSHLLLMPCFGAEGIQGEKGSGSPTAKCTLHSPLRLIDSCKTPSSSTRCVKE